MPDQTPVRSLSATGNLTRRTLNALLRGRYAHLGGRTVASRGKRLAEIECAYTREELAAERGVCAATITEIEFWLRARGLCLRSNGEA